MRDSILKARIRVVGGDKLIETFDDFAKHGKVAMKLVDREAAKATREVQKLKRELDALDRAARNIRARIKIDARTGPTAAQAASLALADRIEAAAAQTRTKLAAAEQALFIEPGHVARTFSAGLNDGADLFDAKRLGREIGDALRDADLGQAILSNKDRNAIAKVAENFEKVSAKTRDDLSAGIAERDRIATEERVSRAVAEVEASQERTRRKREADAKERLDKARDRAEKAHRRNAKRLKDEAELEARLRDEAERENRRRDRSEAARDKIKARRRLEREKDDAHQIEAIFAEHHRQRRIIEEEADYQRQQAAERERRHAAEIERIRTETARKVRAAAEAPPKPDATPGVDVDGRDRLDGKASVPDSSDNISRTGRAASRAARELDAFKQGADRAAKALKGIDGKGIGRVFTGIARGASGAISDLKRFTGALTALEYALGNVALRTGVAGIIAAIAVALGALGGGAALLGIGALAGLAAFDAAKLDRAAKALNMPLERFTGLRYAAARSGVAFDDFNNSLQAVRQTLLDIHKGEAGDAAALARRYGIKLYSPDYQDVASAESVLKQITDLYHSFPEGQQRTTLLESFGLLELEPLIRKTNRGIDELVRRADKVGVVLSSADIERWEEMRSALWDTWEIIKGLGYALASAISPDLMPVLQAINDWLVVNSDRIVKFLVDSFNYLLQVTKDFWNLFKGRDELVVTAWTKQVWDFGEAVVEAFASAWKAIKAVYDFAHPVLQKLGELIYGEDNKNAGLKLTLTAIGAQLLGVTGLIVSFGRTVGAAFALVWGLGKRFLLPVLNWALGIVGWPFLLAAGGVLVYAFWDDVKKWAGEAWAHFKTTFPEAAGVIEGAFNKAKPYITDFFNEFQKNYPNLAGLADEVALGLDAVWERVSKWDWGEMGSDAAALAFYMLDNTAKSLLILFDALKPLLEYFVVNFVDSVLTLLETLGEVYSFLKKIFTEFGRGGVQASVEHVRENTNPVVANAVSTLIPAHSILDNALRVLNAARRVGDPDAEDWNFNWIADGMLPLMPGYGGPVQARGAPAPAQAMAQGTPVVINFPNMDSMGLWTDESAVATRFNDGVKAGLPRPRGR